jgi:hypothetical protein
MWTTLTSTISPAALTVTAQSVSRTYDGTTAASGSGNAGLLAGAGAGELVNTAGNSVLPGQERGHRQQGGARTRRDHQGQFGNADVTGNYNISYVDNTASTISPAALTVTAQQVSRTYDGTTTASGNGSVGLLLGAGSQARPSTRRGTQAFLDKNVGTGNKVVRATGVTIKDSSNADVTGNYNISYVDNTASTISPAALTVTAQSVSRTYNGTTTASGNGSVGLLLGAGAGETVNTAGTQAFLDKNVGTGNKVVRATGVTIKDSGNADVTGNYAITYLDNLTSTINPAALTVTAQQVSRTYNGTTTASGNGSVGLLLGAGAGETVNTAGTQAFLDKNVGTGNKVVRASGVTIKDSGNADVTGNYNISYVDNTASTISPAALTVTAQSVSRTYDGTTTASGSGSVGLLLGAGAGETVNTAGTQAFLDKNVGTGNKVVRATGVTIKDSGNADVTGNYSITYVDNTASTISPAALTVTAQSVSRTYDGTTTASGSGSVGLGPAAWRGRRRDRQHGGDPGFPGQKRGRRQQGGAGLGRDRQGQRQRRRHRQLQHHLRRQRSQHHQPAPVVNLDWQRERWFVEQRRQLGRPARRQQCGGRDHRVGQRCGGLRPHHTDQPAILEQRRAPYARGRQSGDLRQSDHSPIWADQWQL